MKTCVLLSNKMILCLHLSGMALVRRRVKTVEVVCRRGCLRQWPATRIGSAPRQQRALHSANAIVTLISANAPSKKQRCKVRRLCVVDFVENVVVGAD